jgi:hypothetical protein
MTADVGSFARLMAAQPGLPADLLAMGDLLADWLRGLGGVITDIGYDVRAARADVVAESPDGTRIVFTLKVLSG